MKLILPILLALLTLAPTMARGDDAPGQVTEVRLRSTVRVAADNTGLTLGDLARIEGPQAVALQSLAITIEKPIATGQWTTLGLESLRTQLKSAQNINFGAIIMHGGDVQITRMIDRQAVPVDPQPAENKTLRNDGPKLQSFIERWVYARLQSNPEGTRLNFNERDRAMLDTPTQGRVVEIRELGRSDMMALGIVVYEQERIVLERTIRFQALVERPVRVTVAQIKRGTPISIESTRTERRWLPTTEPIADPDASLGKVTVSTLDPGTMLLASMLEAPIIVERGQIVSARSIAGSVSVSLRVRARQDGRMGEVIELESRDRQQKFHARVAGPGRVVIMHDAAGSERTAHNGRP